MYSKTVHHGFFTNAIITTFYRDGVRVGYREDNNPIQLDPFRYERDTAIIIKRNYAFRMWDKHWHGWPCWRLPALLEAATYSNVAYIVYFPERGIYDAYDEYHGILFTRSLEEDEQERNLIPAFYPTFEEDGWNE